MKRTTALMFAATATLAAGVGAQTPSPPQLANPASVNCAKQGGQLNIERRPDGGQFGVCVFTDNYQFEEWALFRGACPQGGLRVTGYVTPAGRYAVTSPPGAVPEMGVCALPGGKACNAVGWYAGTCGP